MENSKNVTREEMLELNDKRNELEGELKTWLEVLKTHKVGMDEKLVDSEGYPRNDIDVHQVRIARNRIIYLRNDLKALMSQIEKGLHNLHSQARETLGDDLAGQLKRTDLEPGNEELCKKSFAKVTSVCENSPASKAGLIVGDFISKFGSITADNFSDLQVLVETARHNQDQEMEVIVIRNGAVKKLQLIPKVWAQKGLLGCNIVANQPILDR